MLFMVTCLAMLHPCRGGGIGPSSATSSISQMDTVSLRRELEDLNNQEVLIDDHIRRMTVIDTIFTYLPNLVQSNRIIEIRYGLMLAICVMIMNEMIGYGA
jgi:hypothetical protein